MSDDQIALAIVSGVAGGTAKEFISGTVGLAKIWLNKYLENHHSKAVQSAENNVWKFVARLSKKVDQLERQAEYHDQLIDRMRNALENPRFSASLQEAILSSALTSDDEKHEILARAVSDQLIAAPESLLELNIKLCIETVPNLAPKHLSYLAISVLVESIRPSNQSIPTDESEIVKYLADWWINSIRLHHPPPIMLPQDYRHLIAMRCISKEPHIRIDMLNHLLAETGIKPIDWGIENFLSATSEGNALKNLWVQGLREHRLLTIGSIIGIYSHDIKRGTDTDLSSWGKDPWWLTQ